MMKNAEDKQKAFRAGLNFTVNWTLLSENTQRFLTRYSGDFDLNEFELGVKFCKHGEKKIRAILRKKIACEILLRAIAEGELKHKLDDKTIEATKILCEIELKGLNEICENASLVQECIRTEFKFGGRANLPNKKFGIKSQDEAEKAVYQIAEKLSEARQTGDSELEAVLKLEMQAAEARLALMKKQNLQ